MVPISMDPRVVEVYAGFNIWVEPSQGYYWVDRFEPAFRTQEEARAFALTQVPPVTPGVLKSVIPYVLIIGAVSALM